MTDHTLTTFDLSSLSLKTGQDTVLEVDLYLPPLKLAEEEYRFEPDTVAARLKLIAAGNGYAANLAFHARLTGVCWRCLEEASLELDVSVDDFFETALPPVSEWGEAEEASLWYSEDGMVNLSAWARDAVAEKLPPKFLCSPDCRGLCASCGANLNLGACGCKPPVDPRWEKLKGWGEGKD